MSLFDTEGMLSDPPLPPPSSTGSPVFGCDVCRGSFGHHSGCSVGGRSGVAARDEALDRVDDHAPTDWKVEADRVIRDLAASTEEFTTDDVWSELPEGARPPEPRALGARMLAASRAGLIVRTDRTVESSRPEAHRSPKRVWRSIST